MTKPLQEILKEESEKYVKEVLEDRFQKAGAICYRAGAKKALALVLERVEDIYLLATDKDYVGRLRDLIKELEKL